MSKEDLQAAVSQLGLSTYKGFAYCYVVDRFDKIYLQAIIWFTVIDCKTNKIQFSEKFIAKPSGFGLRNYWLNTFYEMIKKIKNERFHAWK